MAPRVKDISFSDSWPMKSYSARTDTWRQPRFVRFSQAFLWSQTCIHIRKQNWHSQWKAKLAFIHSHKQIHINTNNMLLCHVQHFAHYTRVSVQTRIKAMVESWDLQDTERTFRDGEWGLDRNPHRRETRLSVIVSFPVCRLGLYLYVVCDSMHSCGETAAHANFLTQHWDVHLVEFGGVQRMYLWWRFCTLYLLARQVGVSAGDSGLNYYDHETSLER